MSLALLSSWESIKCHDISMRDKRILFFKRLVSFILNSFNYF